ncbi:CRISPR-associated DxTHG motif protein [Aquimarina sp. RZ0]|nr:CRISPR-associated DxTHG motif protein [Aquimarina sp. RZ0]
MNHSINSMPLVTKTLINCVNHKVNTNFICK